MQVAVTAFAVATMFIRPTMKRNNLTDTSKYASALFYCLVNMLFDGFTEMALTIDTLPQFYKQVSISEPSVCAAGCTYSFTAQTDFVGLVAVLSILGELAEMTCWLTIAQHNSCSHRTAISSYYDHLTASASCT